MFIIDDVRSSASSSKLSSAREYHSSVSSDHSTNPSEFLDDHQNRPSSRISRDSDYRIDKSERSARAEAQTKPRETKMKVSSGCGPSPPRELQNETATFSPSPPVSPQPAKELKPTIRKVSTGCGPSPPREIHEIISRSPSPPLSPPPAKEVKPTRVRKVSTGTSPPPQSISTQVLKQTPSSAAAQLILIKSLNPSARHTKFFIRKMWRNKSFRPVAVGSIGMRTSVHTRWQPPTQLGCICHVP